MEEGSDLNKPLAKDAELWMSIASACAYGLIGLLMGFFNKAVLEDWPYPNSFLTLQMAVSIVIVNVMQVSGLTTVQPLQLNAVKNLLPVVFFYNTNVAFALVAVRALSIPVYHVLKRLTPVMVLAGKFLIWGNTTSIEIALSVLTVVSGCLMAGLGDLSFDFSGYSAALMSCALQSTYLILVERSGTEKGFNSMELLLYNGMLSLPVLLAITLATGEVWDSVESIQYQLAENALFLPLLISSLLMGSLLNYCLFLCTLCNSALTTTIVGTLRSVFGTVAGFFVFGGVKGTAFMFLGVTFNTIGGVGYTIIKYREKQPNTSQNRVRLEK
nr:UDP-galactose/UDP-glucose transporter 7-like isoform X2 [Physcomitrium patens]|eukprot:XP_024379900.1 UDP-galactose/UDP-glucose transporter 7-like isoform X2 [Physcomitrella patens]